MNVVIVRSQLIEAIERNRPDVLSDYSLSRKQVRLTRRELESWSTTAQLNAILILDVDTGLVQAEDWSAWLSLFYRMGFAGVVAPTIAPDLGRLWPFMQRFIQGFLWKALQLVKLCAMRAAGCG